MSERLIVGPWEADPSRNVLSARGREVRVEPKVMALLVVLMQRRGEVVSKEQLMASVWPGVHVTDSVLTTTVYQLRRVLGSDAIETIPRRGYRLRIADVPPRRWPWIAPAAAAIAVVLILPLSLFRLHQRRAVAGELATVAFAMIERHGDLDTAAETLERVARDNPTPPVLGSLAYASVLRGGSRLDAFARAEETARRAVEREPRNAEARIALALVALWRDWRWDEADRQLRRAAAGPRTRVWRAYVAALRANESAARASLRQLDDGDVTPDVALSAATTALLLGSFDESERFVTLAAAGGGAPAAVRAMQQKIRERRNEILPRGSDPVAANAALADLERAAANRDSRVLYLNVDRRWDHLRHHPRFRAVLRTAGL